MEGSSLGLVVRGDLSREKYSEGESPGENFPGGNYSEVIVHWPKFQRLIVLGGGISSGQLSGGLLSRG